MRAAVTTEVIDVEGLVAQVAGDDRGAVLTFSGVVRDHDHGRAVTRLEYVAHPQAEAVLSQIVAEIEKRDGVEAVAAVHRIGQLEIGDAALVVAVSGAHSQPVFDATRQTVAEIKARLPVWKRQEFTDGTVEWVNCPTHKQLPQPFGKEP